MHKELTKTLTRRRLHRFVGLSPATTCGCCLGILSIREGWDHYLLILVCLYVLWGCGKLLWEEYRPNLDDQKSKGKDRQEPSKANQLIGLPLQPLRERLLGLGDLKKLGKLALLPFRNCRLLRRPGHAKDSIANVRVIALGINHRQLRIEPNAELSDRRDNPNA